MRKIKFRGQMFDGKFVYGYFVPNCPMSSFPGIIDDSEFIHEVKPESVKQLVGVDSNGNEIFEDDILVDEQDCEYVALLQPAICWLQPTDEANQMPEYLRTSPLDRVKNFTKLTLKEDARD